jgi:hypothetical protein
MLMQSMKMGWVEHVTDTAERNNVYKILVGVSDNKALARRRSAWAGKY